MDEHGGGDTRAAVRDDFTGWDSRQRLVPGRVPRAGNVSGDRVNRLDVPAVPLGDARVEQDEVLQTLLQLAGLDRVAAAATRGEFGRLMSSSPALNGPSQPSRSRTAQSSWPKWRNSHQSRSAPPIVP